MYSAGLFGMLAPRAWGGHEIHPVAYSQVIEAVAQIDAAAAWNLHMKEGFGCLAAGIPTIASAFNPPAAAVRTDGGWRVTGRVPFASGCQNARWLAMPAIEMEAGQPKTDPQTGQPKPLLVFFPRSGLRWRPAPKRCRSSMMSSEHRRCGLACRSNGISATCTS